MQIETLSTDLALAFVTDATDTSFPSKVPTVTEPTNDGVMPTGGSSQACNALVFNIIGTGADNAVITGVRVIGWKKKTPNKAGNKKTLWVPTVLCELGAVLGNIAGVANTDVGASYFFADTITLITGNANISNEIVSPTGDIIAHVVVDVKGCEKIEFTVDLGANATGCNILVSQI